MRFLVTGCTGFIGLHLTRQLLDEGHEVVGLVRTPGKLPADLAARIEVLRGDLSLFRDPDVVLPQVDVVVHLAAVIAGKDEAEYHALNHAAVLDVLGALRRQPWRPARFLFASSLAAAGPTVGDAPHRESDTTAPIDPYGLAKREAERAMSEQPFPTTCFRPPIVLGPGDPATLTLYRMARRWFAPLPAGPPQRLSFVDVRDLVRAIITMAQEPGAEHRVYYATSEQVITNRELVRSMAQAQGRRVHIVPVPRFVLFVAMLVATAFARALRLRNQLDRKQYEQMTAPAFVCTSEALSAATGWVAEHDLDASTAHSVAGYRALGQLPA